MRKLTGLDEKLIALFDETKPENIESMPTYRHLLKMAAGQGQPKNADESRRMGRIIRKLRKETDVELSDEEFQALMARLCDNQPGFLVSIHSQLLEKLDACNQ
jgi:hypothetical protein